jgi:hypothetical protein
MDAFDDYKFKLRIKHKYFALLADARTLQTDRAIIPERLEEIPLPFSGNSPGFS